MKKVINRKVYDTDTAQLVGEWENGVGRGDFSYTKEALYKKKTGEYFLYGYGGPASAYAEWSGYNNAYTKGDGFTLLTFDEARDWAEKRLDADEYLKFFDPEPEGMATIMATISAEDKAKIDRLRSDGRTIAQVLHDLLAEV